MGVSEQAAAMCSELPSAQATCGGGTRAMPPRRAGRRLTRGRLLLLLLLRLRLLLARLLRRGRRLLQRLLRGGGRQLRGLLRQLSGLLGLAQQLLLCRRLLLR